MHTHWTQEYSSSDAKLLQIGREIHRLKHRIRDLGQARSRFADEEAASIRRRTQLSTQLAALEQGRDQAAASLAEHRAAVADAQRNLHASAELTSRLESLNADLALSVARQEESQAQIATNAQAAERATKAVDKASRDVAAAQAALVAIRNGTGDGARDQYLDHALQLLKTLAIGLGTPELTTDQIRLIVHKAGRLLSHATRSGAAQLLAELKSAQKHLEAAMTKRETAVEHQTNISITARSLEIDLVHLDADRIRLAAAREELLTRIRALEPNAARLEELAAAEHEAASELTNVTDQLERQRSQLASLSLEVGSSGEAQIITTFERTTAALEALQASQLSLEGARAGAAVNLNQTKDRAGEWGVEITRSSGGESLAQLTDALARAEARLEALAQNREDQIGQYQQVSDRSSALAAQIADLETAQSDLGQLVSELDILIRTRFTEAFGALALQFTQYFGRLFEGGNASLELTETPDQSYGIVIKASPKGKRLTHIAALSGGERALAGVALIAAIMRVNPSPFVVLDEIDAALDEANSGRLSGILSELAEYSQLIVITHNRQTMKAARVLFGVTSSDRQASHLISMRLEEATQLAAR
jgi:chromosome segregation protein